MSDLSEAYLAVLSKESIDEAAKREMNRRSIETQTKEFIAKGGSITVLPTGLVARPIEADLKDNGKYKKKQDYNGKYFIDRQRNNEKQIAPCAIKTPLPVHP